MKMFSMRVPGTTFGKNGNIIYTAESGDTAKFFEYSVHILSYVNSIKTQDPILGAVHGGGRVNCYVLRIQASVK